MRILELGGFSSYRTLLFFFFQDEGGFVRIATSDPSFDSVLLPRTQPRWCRLSCTKIGRLEHVQHSTTHSLESFLAREREKGGEARGREEGKKKNLLITALIGFAERIRNQTGSPQPDRSRWIDVVRRNIYVGGSDTQRNQAIDEEIRYEDN